MKIAGFKIGKKQIIAFLFIVGIIVIISMAQSYSKKKEKEERIKAEQERLAREAAANGEKGETLSLEEQIQQELVEEYGNPPEGFKWSYTGELIALSDDKLTAEDVVYTYIRALSILDFSTAQRYASDSTTIDNYQSYYSDYKADLTDYYNDFLRKQFKFSISSIEVLGIEDVAIFADGTEYMTVKIRSTDLEDKDFWRDDAEALFEQMRLYDETESDDVKKEKYIYEYIYSKYQDGTIGKKERTLEVVVSKENNSGWLVSNDGELCDILSYANGVDVAQYIFQEYDNWLLEKQLSEEMENR